MLHQVGVGTLGPVFRTYEPTRDRLVAVKVFRLDITPEQAQSLADELTRAAEAGLFHPSIVEPIAAGVQGTVAYRADEYVAAESLDVAMRHYAPAALDKVLPFITQLAGAIDFARAAGVGHGALHPRDIFVTPDEARATGFGVVDALERVGLRAPIRRPYSAPERIDGQPWGAPADVFSLAAIAFELLTGRRPSGLGDQIGTLAGASVGDQADALHAVLARAMSESPDDRFPTALAFASALEGAARPGASASEFAPSKPATVAPVIPLAAQLPAREEALSVQPPVVEDDVVVEDEDDVVVEDDDDVVEVDRDVDVASAALGVAGVDLDDDAGDRDVVEVDEVRDVEVDDIAAEREEDEAHWSLTQAEQQAPPSAPEADPTRMFDDEQTEAARDRLVFDAVDLTLGDEHPIDRRFNYEFIDPPNTVAPLDERADEPPPLPPPVVPLAPEPPIRPVHEARRRARPIVSSAADDRAGAGARAGARRSSPGTSAGADRTRRLSRYRAAGSVGETGARTRQASDSADCHCPDTGDVALVCRRLFRPRPRRHAAGNAIGRSGDADGGSDNPCVSAAGAPRKAFQRTGGDAAACHDGNAAGSGTRCSRRCPGTGALERHPRRKRLVQHPPRRRPANFRCGRIRRVHRSR